MNVRGARNVAVFSAEPDIKDWTDRIAVNPARVPPGYPASPALDDTVVAGGNLGPGAPRLAELGGLPA